MLAVMYADSFSVIGYGAAVSGVKEIQGIRQKVSSRDRVKQEEEACWKMGFPLI